MKKIALIGFGNWGNNLARVLSGTGNLHYICDVDSRKLKIAKELYPSIAITHEVDSLLLKDLDAVVIATPAKTHFSLAKKMLSLNKDVFVEKPLALSFREGLELLKIAEQNKLVLMVGHILQYHPGILKLKEMIDNKELGKINYIYSNRLNIGKFRKEENILWSFAPHDISVMLFLLKETPRYVSCCGGTYLNKGIADVTVSDLLFKSGVNAHIFVSWLHPFKEQKLIVIGTKKMVVFDDIIDKDKLVCYNHKIDILNGNYEVLYKDKANIVEFKMSEPLKKECEEFMRCIEYRDKPLTDGKNGLEVLSILEACHESFKKKGKPVKVNL